MVREPRSGRHEVRPQDAAGTANTLDLRFLQEAAKSVLGYFVFTWFNHYLSLIYDNLRRYFDAGLMAGLTEPTEVGRYRIIFDFGAIDLEKLVYVNGIYFYVLSAHKGANRQLMNQYDGKQVLYLRGYDYEGSVSTGEGMAVGFSSTHTMQFTALLGGLLAPDKHDVALYKILSPKDVYWETVGAQNYFYTDFAKVIALAQYPMRSLYLNAARWQEDVETLLDRMDHYLVYVSSITESVLWELDQLDRDDRRARVTVIFDEEAIKNKETQLGIRDGMRSRFPQQVIWAKNDSELRQQEADELRAYLASRFLVTTPQDFESDIETHRRRIAQDAAPLSPQERTTSLEFNFRPGVDSNDLRKVETFSAEMQSHLDEWTGERGIDSLPAFLNIVQLRIFCTLLMGEHHETGRALACYAAVLSGAYDYYSAPDVPVGALSPDRREEHLAMLRDHVDQAARLGWTFLSYGGSNEFGDYRNAATTTYDAAYERTESAVSAFFAAVVKLNT